MLIKKYMVKWIIDLDSKGSRFSLFIIRITILSNYIVMFIYVFCLIIIFLKVFLSYEVV